MGDGSGTALPANGPATALDAQIIRSGTHDHQVFDIFGQWE